MKTTELDFVPSVEPGKWNVYVKNSYFLVGRIEWTGVKYEYVANANGGILGLTHKEEFRRELAQFCSEQTSERLETGGNR